MGEGTLCTGWATAAAAPPRHLANEPPQPHPGEPSCVRSMLTTEVAELTGKRHDHVMRDARKMLVELHGEGGLPKFGDTYRNEQNGQDYPCYRLPKRELMVLVTGYSVAPARPRLPWQPAGHVRKGWRAVGGDASRGRHGTGLDQATCQTQRGCRSLRGA
ncbi:Rha family transcriptional regulator [Methylobacterium sp. NMS12]